jgi:preprotein translocase subunit SecB
MAVPAALVFKGYEITKVILDKPKGFSEGHFNVSFQHVNHILNENPNIFDADFIVSVVSEDKSFNLQIQALAFFEISGEVDESVRNNYLNISSPSILYPYLRAFITNLVIQSGMKPIIIPPINFGAKPKESTEVQ